ncbi:MAG: GerW family sporulation protein [Lachnospiraceae bacterium]
MAKESKVLNTTITSLLEGLDGFVSSKTVVGEPVVVNDTIVIPLVDVQFGVGVGAYASDTKDKNAGGVGAKMSPNAVLIIQNGMTRLISIKNQDVVSKVLDMVPDLVNRFTNGKPEDNPEVKAAVDKVLDNEEKTEG